MIKNKFHKNAGVIIKTTYLYSLGIILCQDGDPDYVWVRNEINVAKRILKEDLIPCKKPKELIIEIEKDKNHDQTTP